MVLFVFIFFFLIAYVAFALRSRSPMVVLESASGQLRVGFGQTAYSHFLITSLAARRRSEGGEEKRENVDKIVTLFGSRRVWCLCVDVIFFLLLFSFVDKRLNLTKIDRTKFNKKKTGTEITEKVGVGFSNSFDESFVGEIFWVFEAF